jgi:hypothetical protein
MGEQPVGQERLHSAGAVNCERRGVVVMTMTNRKLVVVVGLGIALGQFDATGASAEPTFEQTRDWIIGKLGENRESSIVHSAYYVKKVLKNVNISECSMSYENHGKLQRESYADETWVQTEEIDLTDIREVTYLDHEQEPSISINTYSNSINYTLDNSADGVNAFLRDDGEIAVKLQGDLQERMVKALTHLGKLAYENPDCPKRPRPESGKDVF